MLFIFLQLFLHRRLLCHLSLHHSRSRKKQQSYISVQLLIANFFMPFAPYFFSNCRAEKLYSFSVRIRCVCIYVLFGASSLHDLIFLGSESDVCIGALRTTSVHHFNCHFLRRRTYTHSGLFLIFTSLLIYYTLCLWFARINSYRTPASSSSLPLLSPFFLRTIPIFKHVPLPTYAHQEHV